MIPLNLIRQYLFCPRIVYYNLLTNITPIYPRQVSLGIDYHKLQNEMLSHRKFKKFNINYQEIINEKYLENTTLNICGKVDLAFICDDEIIPIEFKNIEHKPNFSHIMQLCGYGILLEKEYNKKFEKAYVVHSNNMKFYEITITNTHLKNFYKVLESINEILNNDILPNSDADKNKCLQCEYLNYCDDRF